MEACPTVDVSYRNASHRTSCDSLRGKGDRLGGKIEPSETSAKGFGVVLETRGEMPPTCQRTVSSI